MAKFKINFLRATTFALISFVVTTLNIGEIQGSEDLLTGESSDRRYLQKLPLVEVVAGYQWFEQRLTHFNVADNRTFLQRYFEFDDYYKEGGPVFLHIDGEGAGLPEFPLDLVIKGSMPEYARKQGAKILALEHRFYGSSKPIGESRLENLRYLSIQEAIEDIASFITWFKSAPGMENQPFVLFGASYAGSLVKWFSQVYPELAGITIMSSAPLELKHEMPDFLASIGKVVKDQNEQCYKNLQRGFSCLEATTNGQNCGLALHNVSDLKEIFGLCETLNPQTELDIYGLSFTIFNIFSNIVINNVPNSQSHFELGNVCKNLNLNSLLESPLEKLGRVVRDITRASGVSCIEYRFESIVNYLQDASPQSPSVISGDRQFEWQQCTQLGWFKASNTKNELFGHKISTKLHDEICKKVFQLTKTDTMSGILAANFIYGSKNVATNCGIFVNGKSDPWAALGLTNQDMAGSCNKVINIQGASHARDKDSILLDGPSYPPTILNAQLEIESILEHWLQTGNCCSFNMQNSSSISLTKSHSSKVFPENQTLIINPSPQFVSISNNSATDIQTNELLSESKRQDSIKAATPNPDKIPIGQDVKFKDVTAFITKHEEQFFTPDADNKRYRLKIRRTGEDSGDGPTYSKFGIKIRMLNPENGDNKDISWENKQDEKSSQWGRWTDFQQSRRTIDDDESIRTPQRRKYSDSSRSARRKSNGESLNPSSMDETGKTSLLIMTLNGNNTEIPMNVVNSTTITQNNSLQQRKIKRVKLRRRRPKQQKQEFSASSIESQEVISQPLTSRLYNSHEDGPLFRSSAEEKNESEDAPQIPLVEEEASNENKRKLKNSRRSKTSSPEENKKDDMINLYLVSNGSRTDQKSRKVFIEIRPPFNSSDSDVDLPTSQFRQKSTSLEYKANGSRREKSRGEEIGINSSFEVRNNRRNENQDVVMFKQRSSRQRFRQRQRSRKLSGSQLLQPSVRESFPSVEVAEERRKGQRKSIVPHRRKNKLSSVYVTAEGIAIPLSDLNWKTGGGPGYVDMSSKISGKKKLALTPADIAWVTYGVPAKKF